MDQPKLKIEKTWQNNLSVNKLLISILFIFICSTSKAQEISSTQYFNKVIENIQENFEDFPSADFDYLKPFYIDEVQFRTETDEFDFNRQEYAVRVKPGNFKLPKLQRQLFNSYYQKSQLVQSQLKADALESAYTIWLNLNLNNQETSFFNTEKVLLKDKAKVYERQLDIPNFNILRLLGTEDNLHKTELDLLTAQIRIKNQSGILAQEFDNEISSIASDLISVKKIKSVLNNALQETVVNKFNVRILNLDQSIIDQEIALENAESQNIIDFVQLRYGGPHDDVFDEKVSISVGINLPTKSRNKLKINELKLDAIKENMDLSSDNVELQYKVDVAHQKVLESIEIYDLIKSQNKSSILTNDVLMSRYETSASTSPLTLLDIQILRHEKDERLYDAKKDVYEDYLDWLILSRKIFEIPFKNYLSEEVELLEYNEDFWGR